MARESNSLKIGLKIHWQDQDNENAQLNHHAPHQHGKVHWGIKEFTYNIPWRQNGCWWWLLSRCEITQQSFVKLKPLRSSSKYKIKTKLRIFKSNVPSVLLYGPKAWNITKAICHSQDILQNCCPRRIFLQKIYWPNVISNKDLLR